MTFAKVGPTLPCNASSMPMRSDETSGGAFEALLGDANGQPADDTPPSTQAVVSAGAAANSPSSVADIIALASRAADTGANASSGSLPGTAPEQGVPDAQVTPTSEGHGVDDEIGTPRDTPARAQKKGPSDDDAQSPTPQPDVALLVSIVAVDPRRPPNAAPPVSAPSRRQAPDAAVTTATSPVAAPRSGDKADASDATVPVLLPTDATVVASVATGQPSLESAIEPTSVQLSTHLGFSRGITAGRAAPTPETDSADPPPQESELAPPAAAATGSGADTGSHSADASPDKAADPSATARAATGPEMVATDAFAMPPASPLIHRVADSVAALAAAPVSAMPETTPYQVAPARTMDLQLAPAGLGTLTVRLHVSGRSLDLRLEASDAGTAAIIDRDRSSLANALASKDLTLQTLSVTTQDAATASTTTQGPPHAEADKGSRFADGGGSGSSGQGADARGPGHQEDRPRQSRRGPAARVERDDAALFV